MIQEENFDAPNVAVKLESVLNRRGKIKSQAEDKKNLLSDSLLYAQFTRDCSEVSTFTLVFLKGLIWKLHLPFTAVFSSLAGGGLD